MSAFIDMTGKRFGRWTVIERRPKPTFQTGTNAWWLVRCDCGTERVLNGRSLRTGNSQSCGCFRADMIREKRKRKVSHES